MVCPSPYLTIPKTLKQKSWTMRSLEYFLNSSLPELLRLSKMSCICAFVYTTIKEELFR